MTASGRVDIRDGSGERARVAYAALSPVLSVVSAATGMLIPMMLSPSDFGRYMLIAGIFQVAVICDLGLGQLMDRRVSGCEAVGQADPWAQASLLLWTRMVLGGGLSLAAMAAALAAGTDALAAMLAAVAGLCFMIADGRVGYFRATSRYRAFTITALYLQVGLILPRLAGILAGGVVGCFLALALWYAVAAGGTARQVAAAPRPGLAAMRGILLAALPLFGSTILWALYMTANRWLSALVSDSEQLGQFSFSANLAYLLVGSLATICQIYYPRISRAFMAGSSQSNRLRNEMALLALAVSACVAIGDALLGPVMRLGFAHFLPSLEASRLILPSVVPLAVASWLLPLLLAVGRRPWADCIAIFAAAFPALAMGMLIGHFFLGLDGQALGCLPGAFVVLAGVQWRLVRARVLTADAAWQLGAAVALCTLLSLVLALWMNAP